MITTHHQIPAYVRAIDSERAATDLDVLVRAAASGEHLAWRTLVSRFRRRLVGLARAHRIPAEEVEDVVQTTFTKLYENIGTLRDPRALPAWLDTTARRECLRTIKASARERPLDTDLIEGLPARDHSPELIGDELSGELANAVNRLSERQRRLIAALFTDDEQSYEELALELGMPIGSIGPTRGRALARLRADARLAAAVAAAEDVPDEHVEAALARSWAVPA